MTGRFTPSPYTFEAMAAAFARRCEVAWEVGMEMNGRPGAVTSVTLPDAVFPELSQLINPLDKSAVPIVRVPLFAVEYPPAVVPS